MSQAVQSGRHLANDLSGEAGARYSDGTPYWEPENDPIAQAFGSGLFAVYLLVLALVTLASMLALLYLLKQAGIKQQ